MSTGDYLDVKTELNAGEYRAVKADMILGGITPGELPKLDPYKVGPARVLAYLVGWSFTDINGQPVPVSAAALDAMYNDVYVEIANAIDAHERRHDQLRADRLKNPSGAGGLRVAS